MSADQTGERIRFAFAQLSRGQPDLSGLDRIIMAAFERLMQGQPTLTDGTVNVTTICAEAGVSRASYYRSPVAPVIKELLQAPTTTPPEQHQLRDEVKRLRRAERDLRREHAAVVRELKDTVVTYANRIQVLTLANAELREENDRPQCQAEERTSVRVLHTAPAAARSLGPNNAETGRASGPRRGPEVNVGQQGYDA